MTGKASSTIYPLSALRAVVLHTQLLTTPDGASPAPTPETIVDLVKALGYVQIDTVHVVNRAQYVTLWARFGAYGMDDFHKLLYTPNQRILYEGWGHAASIIPLENYRYHRWRTDRSISYNPSFHEWVNKKNNRELAEQTLERIRTDGGLRVGDFEHKGPEKGVWYDWKPSKMALEALFAWGDLMVADRVNFQRVYDIRDRVLPEWVDTTPVDPDEALPLLPGTGSEVAWCIRAAPSHPLRLHEIYACPIDDQNPYQGRRAGRDSG